MRTAFKTGTKIYIFNNNNDIDNVNPYKSQFSEHEMEFGENILHGIVNVIGMDHATSYYKMKFYFVSITTIILSAINPIPILC